MGPVHTPKSARVVRILLAERSKNPFMIWLPDPTHLLSEYGGWIQAFHNGLIGIYQGFVNQLNSDVVLE